MAPAVFRNGDFTGVDGLLKIYLDHRRESDQPVRAAVGIAAPILSDQVEMVNIDWQFSQAELAEQFKFKRLMVVNDFAAIAWGLPYFGPADLKSVGAGSTVPHAPMAVIGPGSGLGVATLVPSTDGWAIAAGEGGNVTISTSTPQEIAVVELLQLNHGHCSAETLISGPGLVNIYTTLGQLKGREVEPVTPAQVTEAAAKGETLARETCKMFFELLGTTTGNLALTVGARGGVFIAGGIIPQLLEPFLKSKFRERFEAKGRYRSYLEAIPTHVITDPLPAFRGLRRLLGYK